jgi:flagellar biosynthesis protein FlhG
VSGTKHSNAGREAAGMRNSRNDTCETTAGTRALQPVKVIAITGGKGGVGKTNVAANLGVALAAMGRQVMLLDADFSLASLDALLGLHPRANLADVLRGDCELSDIIVTGPRGVQVVPAASGVPEMTHMSIAEHAGLIRAFSDLDQHLDILLIDTAAGLSESVTTFSHAAHHVVVVVCNEPASIAGACALIRLLAREHGITRFQVLVNQAIAPEEGLQVFATVSRQCEQHLAVNLEYAGAVPHDEHLRRAVREQVPVVDAFPASPAAIAFRNVANKADQWMVPQGARGHLEFFIERFVQGGASLEGCLQ